MRSSKRKTQSFLGLLTSSMVTGSIVGILLKYIGILPLEMAGIEWQCGILLFMWIPIDYLFNWKNKTRPKQTRLQISRGGYSSLNAIIRSLQSVKINGRTSFLKSINQIDGGYIKYKEPKPVANQVKLLKTIQVDRVFFSSIDNNGSTVQIPERVLWRLLKFAEKHRSRGIGLSERSLTGKGRGKKYLHVLENTYLYWPIVNLLFAVQNESSKWIKPNGIEIVKTTKNQWNILMPSASMTYRLCIIYQFGSELNSIEVKKMLKGGGVLK